MHCADLSIELNQANIEHVGLTLSVEYDVIYFTL